MERHSVKELHLAKKLHLEKKLHLGKELHPPKIDLSHPLPQVEVDPCRPTTVSDPHGPSASCSLLPETRENVVSPTQIDISTSADTPRTKQTDVQTNHELGREASSSDSRANQPSFPPESKTLQSLTDPRPVRKFVWKILTSIARFENNKYQTNVADLWLDVKDIQNNTEEAVKLILLDAGFEEWHAMRIAVILKSAVTQDEERATPTNESVAIHRSTDASPDQTQEEARAKPTNESVTLPKELSETPQKDAEQLGVAKSSLANPSLPQHAIDTPDTPELNFFEKCLVDFLFPVMQVATNLALFLLGKYLWERV